MHFADQKGSRHATQLLTCVVHGRANWVDARTHVRKRCLENASLDFLERCTRLIALYIAYRGVTETAEAVRSTCKDALLPFRPAKPSKYAYGLHLSWRVCHDVRPDR